MSRYVVSKTVIDALITAAVKWASESGSAFTYHWHHGSGRVDADTATPVGQMLWHANWYAAEGWFREADWATEQDLAEVPDEPVYEYEPLTGWPDPLVVLRLIANYTYQTADEPEEWRPSEAFGFLHALEGAAHDRLPGIRELPWTLGEEDRDIFLRYGGPEPVVEPVPVDSDNPNWVAVNDKLSATNIPFRASTPQERRRQGTGDDSLEGSWASWPPDLGSAFIAVSLYRSDAAAAEGFAHASDIGRQRLGPRWSSETLRVGRIVLALYTDHWNSDLDEPLDRIRRAFGDAEDYWSASHVLRAANAPIIVRRWNDDEARWEATRDGEPAFTDVEDLADAYRAAQQRGVWLLVDNATYADMVNRGDAPADRPSWAYGRAVGGPRVP